MELETDGDGGGVALSSLIIVMMIIVMVTTMIWFFYMDQIFCPTLGPVHTDQLMKKS